MVPACPSCKAPAGAGQKFCSQCGAKIPAAACAACGAKVAPESRFCAACGRPVAPLSHEGETKRRMADKAAEERRWATVLFADLSGFTAMSEKMDPEDVKALAGRGIDRLSEQVRRFGGTVMNVMGDSVLAVFGAPVAQGDDAERAVRAALAMRAVPLTDDPARPLALHIGVNTGEVMAGLMGPLERRDYTVMGDAVNTAARLMTAAAPGSILIGEETYRATRRAVRCRQAPEVKAKGKQEPVPAWEALDLLPESETQVRRATPFVGREEELQLLGRIWTKVSRESVPHLTTVIGEAGVGKSRLVAEFERQILAGGAAVAHGRCAPYGEALGYSALAQAIRTLVGITTGDKAEAASEKLCSFARVLGEEGCLSAEASTAGRHLALLMGIATPDDPALRLPDQRTLHTSVRAFLEAVARRGPLCLILEDIHGADDALLDLVEFVASHAQSAALMIFTVARPELLEKRKTWGGGVRAYTSLPLGPVSDDAARELIVALLPPTDVPGDRVEAICRMARGNPLFVEELAATVTERGLSTVVPSTIKALVAARLDQLTAERKRILQVASVFGEVFWIGGVAALGRLTHVEDDLEFLQGRDLIRRERRSQIQGDVEYAFKHALIRDTAYEMLPRAERRTLHGELVDWIERTVRDRADEYLDLLAHHAAAADRKDRALDYLSRAAERARRAAANREEAALLARAIALAEEKGDTPLQAELHARCGRAWAAVGLWAKARPEMEEALRGMPVGAEERRAEVAADLAKTCFWLMDLTAARSRAEEVVAAAGRLKREDLTDAATLVLAVSAQAEGDLSTGIRRYLEIIERSRGRCSPVLADATQFHALTLYWTGRMDEAVERSREAVRVSREVGDTSIIMQSLPHHALSLAGRGRYREALKIFTEAVRFGKEYGVDNLTARAIVMQGGVHLELSDHARAQALAEEAAEMGRSANFPPSVISAGLDLLFNHARRGEPGKAEKILGDVQAAAAKASGWHGWLWKMRLAQAQTELALARGETELALPFIEETLQRSRATGRVKYEAAALGARARAWLALGRKREAIGAMREAIDRVRPIGDPALFLRAAAALLEVEPEEPLAREAARRVDEMKQELAGTPLLTAFESSVPARVVTRLTR